MDFLFRSFRRRRPLNRPRFHLKVATICFVVLPIFLSPANSRAGGQETNDVRKEEKTRKRVFDFEGGSPVDFIVALDRHFRTRLMQILTLPETLSRTKVPKLRVAAEDPREVLSLYNRLDNPALGQWQFEPSQKSAETNMNVLMLVPGKGAAGTPMRVATRVKGVALAGVPESNWNTLIQDIEEAKKYADEVAVQSGGDVFIGSIRVQRSSKILIAAGSDAYLEMVESMIQAHRLNASIEATNSNSTASSPARTSEPAQNK